MSSWKQIMKEKGKTMAQKRAEWAAIKASMPVVVPVARVRKPRSTTGLKKYQHALKKLHHLEAMDYKVHHPVLAHKRLKMAQLKREENILKGEIKRKKKQLTVHKKKIVKQRKTMAKKPRKPRTRKVMIVA